MAGGKLRNNDALLLLERKCSIQVLRGDPCVPGSSCLEWSLQLTEQKRDEEGVILAHMPQILAFLLYFHRCS